MDSRRMRRALPPFPAIRAFEAAARHQSFKAAAEELCVTQSAISHQVKGLEKFLGVRLFRRKANGVEVTRSGTNYFDELAQILDRLNDSTEKVKGIELSGTLSLCATPAFTSRWLLPHMGSFNYAYPEIEMEVTTTENPMAFPEEGVDVLIQYGQKPMKGYRTDPFVSTTRFPVCSPEFIEKGPVIKNPEDLVQVNLLRDVVGDDWVNWFACAGSKVPEKIKGPRFAHCELTMKAAEEGLGVALAYGFLISDEIANGKLVKLFDLETPPKVIYSLTCSESRSNHSRIAVFRNWIIAESAAGIGSQLH
ncbi:MAG: transcriptional regulator GcvA [Rhodospirillales bacterium]|nr:transcriptional regulator GcvA [Rhodospirillales bacterium]